jgi:hypothetical protein
MSLNSTASSSSSVSASASASQMASVTQTSSAFPSISMSAYPSAYPTTSASVSGSISQSATSTATFILSPQQIVASKISLDGWIAIFSSVGVLLLCSIILSICYYRMYQKEKLKRLRLEQVEKRMTLQMATSRMSSVRDFMNNRV